MEKTMTNLRYGMRPTFTGAIMGLRFSLLSFQAIIMRLSQSEEDPELRREHSRNVDVNPNVDTVSDTCRDIEVNSDSDSDTDRQDSSQETEAEYRNHIIQDTTNKLLTRSFQYHFEKHEIVFAEERPHSNQEKVIEIPCQSNNLLSGNVLSSVDTKAHYIRYHNGDQWFQIWITRPFEDEDSWISVVTNVKTEIITTTYISRQSQEEAQSLALKQISIQDEKIIGERNPPTTGSNIQCKKLVV